MLWSMRSQSRSEEDLGKPTLYIALHISERVTGLAEALLIGTTNEYILVTSRHHTLSCPLPHTAFLLVHGPIVPNFSLSSPSVCGFAGLTIAKP